MKKKKTIWLFMFISALTLFACVTINIYFPAEQVESIAEEIVNDIRGGDNGKGSPNDSSSLLQDTILALFSSAAWAQDVTSVSNPTIRGLKNKLKNNYNNLKTFYQKGNVKEGNNGYLSITNEKGLGLKDKRNLKNLVNAENSLRKQLYQEVAKAVKTDLSQLDKIAKIFAEKWKESAP